MKTPRLASTPPLRRTRDLLGGELDLLIARPDRLNTGANETTSKGKWGGQKAVDHRGLNARGRAELEHIGVDRLKVHGIVGRGRRINYLIGGAGWDALLADCPVAGDAAQEVYNSGQ